MLECVRKCFSMPVKMGHLWLGGQWLLANVMLFNDNDKTLLAFGLEAGGAC